MCQHETFHKNQDLKLQRTTDIDSIGQLEEKLHVQRKNTRELQQVLHSTTDSGYAKCNAKQFTTRQNLGGTTKLERNS